MPTTVVEKASRVYGSEGYADRLRRPVHLEGLGASCPDGYTFRSAAGQCFCDPVLEGLGALAYAIPCPTVRAGAQPYSQPAPLTVRAKQPTQYVPSTYQEPKAGEEPAPAGEESVPVTIPVHKATPPWVWLAGGGGALVVFWLFWRNKKKR